MRRASEELKDALFIEYWGESGSLANRIAKWLANADTEADSWKPSKGYRFEGGQPLGTFSTAHSTLKGLVSPTGFEPVLLP